MADADEEEELAAALLSDVVKLVDVRTEELELETVEVELEAAELEL